jgi:cytochrome c oxidase assembly protein subunit 15
VVYREFVEHEHMESSVTAMGNIGAGGDRRGADRQVAAWLLVCCGMLFAMVVVGGVTRLTHSGLSIVEWRPLVGTLPPLSAEQWNDTFLKYQQTPEFQKVNHGMGLDEFKGIFWWEYFHRLLGRLIGVVFLLPLVYFAVARKIDKRLVPRLAVIFVLGGLQGALGWYMVKSGLVDDPRVSQYRLTAHLGMAFLIHAAMLWVALDLWWGRRREPESARASAGLRDFARWLSLLIFLMALSGGFVAGIRAGSAYNTFPLMNGNWVPPEIFMLDPWYLNFFNNMATVQFDHRLFAWLLAFLIPAFWWLARKAQLDARTMLLTHLMLGIFAVQIALGIATLLLVVPVGLAAAHQGGALLLFTLSLMVTHEVAA